MALELTDELRGKLRWAKPEEAEAILAEAGIKATAEQLEHLKGELNWSVEQNGETLSLDELDAVAGGAWDYDYALLGCAATVEYGSDCFGSDAGCDVVYNCYRRAPVNVKCDCGHYMYKDHMQLIGDTTEGSYGVLKCPYCKSTIDVDGRIYNGLN